MISAREFCREPGYPITVLLTYSFDPLFFERIALTDLDIGGARRIVVIGDGHQISDAISRSVGQLVHLGRRYLLAETIIPNTFHPKLIARLSPEGGRVWVGSGNLTYTGWGGNREVAAAWPVGPGQEDDGVWLNELFEAVGALVPSATLAAKLDVIRNVTPWLTVAGDDMRPRPVLLGIPDRPLAPQLAERWKGRRFNEVMLCTGSTDTDGAFLSWAHRTFGIKRATICLSPAFASFDPKALGKLPLDVKIVKAPPDQLMHAKCYWFAGRDGNAAVIGSANCSAAAWLAGGGHGNVELVVPYDNADAEDFAAVLKTFEAKKLTPARALPSKPPEQTKLEEAAEPVYRLVGLRLRPHGGMIEAVIKPEPSSDRVVDIVLGTTKRTWRARLARQANSWCARLPSDFELGLLTPFAHVEIIAGKVRHVSNPRWLDNDAALERASREEAVDSDMRDLSRRNLFTTDHQRIMEAVYTLSAQLLHTDDEEDGRGAGGAARSVTPAPGEKMAEDTARAVDPAAIVRTLKDLRIENQIKAKRPGSIYAGTLEGVIAQLFSREDEEDIDLSHEAWTGEAEKAMETANEADEPPSPDGKAATPAEVMVQFHEQIDYFLQELSNSKFAESCDPKRLVQALAFPLFLCARGAEESWLPARLSAVIAARVVSIMFDRDYGPNIPHGLFRRVQARYAALAKTDEFLRAVGDGTLWSALIASLASIEATSFKYVVQYAAAISAVFACKELITYSDAEQLAVLIPGLIIENAEAALTERAPRIADAAASLTRVLSEKWDILNKEQGNGREYQPAGAVLWASRWGWRLLPGSPAETYCYGYINVEKAASTHRDIREAVDVLVASAAPSRNLAEGQATLLQTSA
jgi:hypothetical protein